jgi:ribosomal protein S18 acetylase RimI-like enzyme
MEIRTLDEADLEAWLVLRLRSLREHPDAFGRTPEEDEDAGRWRQYFRTMASDGDGFVLGAFANSLVGLVGCQREAPTKARHRAFIWGMYVAPEVRQRGIGRWLLAETIALARRWEDFDHLALSVMTHQAAARHLYLACGFEPIGVHRRALRVGARYYDEERMVLWLR